MYTIYIDRSTKAPPWVGFLGGLGGVPGNAYPRTCIQGARREGRFERLIKIVLSIAYALYMYRSTYDQGSLLEPGVGFPGGGVPG